MLIIPNISNSFAFDDRPYCDYGDSTSTLLESIIEKGVQSGFNCCINMENHQAEDIAYVEDIEEWNLQEDVSMMLPKTTLDIWTIGNDRYTYSRSIGYKQRMKQRKEKYNATVLQMSDYEKQVINRARNLLCEKEESSLCKIPRKRAFEVNVEESDIVDLTEEVTLGKLIFVAKNINSPILRYKIIIFGKSRKIKFKGLLVDACKEVLNKYVYY